MPARSCVALALVFGLFMTLVMAWVCALWSPVNDPLPRNAVDVAAIINTDAVPPQSEVVRAGFGYAEFGSTTIESVDLETGQSWQMQSPVPVLVESRAGWPCLCLTRCPASGILQGNWLDQGVAIKDGALGVIDGRRIPLRPIWVGVVGNTVFFAATLLFMAWASGQIHSKWLRSKGRCGNCGYPVVRSSTCPECGRAAV